ncbi:hypothetical protein GCM10011369_07620 [Neiella marina]|uniref:DUF1853 family protein n=1 Tax=Neiella marina TaxID=508461 RepID=A0A8J2U2T2_9GAMM|nr:DUF1853 family protein [Neiella marina]GGA68446.1 hypothetical protein GCM10011369_07620 [Neiella marina]
MKKNYEIIDDLRVLLFGTAPIDQTLPFGHDRAWLDCFRQRLLHHQPDIASIAEQVQRPHSVRLGLYVEQLWLALISAHPDYQLLSHNLQVIDNKQTVGAFDFLVRHLNVGGNSNKTRIEHWELACKYYLAVTPEVEELAPDIWLGPNLNDDWLSKRHKLTAKQIKLGELPAAQVALSRLGIAQIDHRMILASGRVFLPASSNSLPQDGHWYTQQQWRKFDNLPATYLQDKLDWLQPKLAGQVLDCHSLQLAKPVFVTTKINSDNKACCFIVPDDWPLRAQKKAAAIHAAAL